MIAQSRSWLGTGLFAAGTVFAVAGSQALCAQPSGFPTQQILRTDLLNIPGQEVLFFTTNWTPGLRLPWHVHPEGHEFAYVVEGELTFEIEGIGEKVVKAGEVLHTPPNVAHYGRNATDKLTKTVIVRVKDKSQPIMMEVKR
jgi:quercetin dioxygenase-like cupin family protein